MFANIFKALRDYASSFKLMSKLSLWRFFLVPILISILIFVSVASLVYIFSDNIGRILSGLWLWDWGKSGFQNVATILGGLSIIALGLIIYKHLLLALSAPFMSPVSERIEKHLYPELCEVHTQRQPSSSFSQQLLRGLRINIRNLAYELLITIPLLLLSFIPVVGIVFTIVLIAVQAYYAGFGNMDYSLERHFNYRDSVKIVARNKGLAIGNGLVFIGMLFIPVVGMILVLPLSVSAATKTTLDLIKKLK